MQRIEVQMTEAYLRGTIRCIIAEICDADGEWLGGQYDTLHEPDESFAYDNEGSSAGAGYMPKQNLFHLGRLAQSVHDSIHDGDPVEDWVEDKIAKAYADIEDVANYVLYRKSRGQDMEEVYRQADYGDIERPTFDYDKVWKGYFEDAQAGLGLDVYAANRYADEHASADEHEHSKAYRKYRLKTRPSTTHGNYPR